MVPLVATLETGSQEGIGCSRGNVGKYLEAVKCDLLPYNRTTPSGVILQVACTTRGTGTGQR